MDCGREPGCTGAATAWPVPGVRGRTVPVARRECVCVCVCGRTAPARYRPRPAPRRRLPHHQAAAPAGRQSAPHAGAEPAQPRHGPRRPVAHPLATGWRRRECRAVGGVHQGPRRGADPLHRRQQLLPGADRPARAERRQRARPEPDPVRPERLGRRPGGRARRTSRRRRGVQRVQADEEPVGLA